MAGRISNNLKNLRNKYPDLAIEETSVFIIDKQLYGTLLAVGATQGVKPITVKDWIKEGLKYSEFKAGNIHLINMKEATDWYRENKNRSYQRNIEKPKVKTVPVPIGNTSTEVFGLRAIDDSEEKKKHFEAELAETKYLKEIGQLVLADKLDQSMAEQATIHLSDIANDEKVLPTLLAEKTASEIDVIFKNHKNERKVQLEKIAKNITKGDASLMDVFEVIRREFASGVSMKEISKRIKG